MLNPVRYFYKHSISVIRNFSGSNSQCFEIEAPIKLKFVADAEFLPN